jgi:isoquinoline 1-oxidoreductase alpha subunit
LTGEFPRNNLADTLFSHSGSIAGCHDRIAGACRRSAALCIRETFGVARLPRAIRPVSSRINAGGDDMIQLTVNGKSHTVDVDPDTPLLWVLRETLGMTGTKYGCGVARCGACTVHVNGQSVRSCGLPVSEAAKARVTTIEGLASGNVLHKVQKAWLDYEVPQCGYCQSGMIMAVAALLNSKPRPTDADIDTAITNICRCGTFVQVRAAIHAAAKA